MSPAKEPSHKKCNVSKKIERILYGCVLFFASLDIYFKFLANNNGLPEIAGNIFAIRFFANPGIAFSIPLPQFITLIITGTLIPLLTWKFFSLKNPKIKIALLATILGAGSNFFDRIYNNFTTDYFILFNTSAINIADILIITGILYCAWYYQSADPQSEE